MLQVREGRVDADSATGQAVGFQNERAQNRENRLVTRRFSRFCARSLVGRHRTRQGDGWESWAVEETSERRGAGSVAEGGRALAHREGGKGQLEPGAGASGRQQRAAGAGR